MGCTGPFHYCLFIPPSTHSSSLSSFLPLEPPPEAPALVKKGLGGLKTRPLMLSMAAAAVWNWCLQEHSFGVDPTAARY